MDCFPKYDLNYEEAFNKYWSEAMSMIDSFIEKYPESSIVFEDFNLQNSIAEQKKLIDFLGLDIQSANYIYKYYADNLNESDINKKLSYLDLKVDIDTETSVSETVYKNMNLVHDELTDISYQYQAQKTLFFRSRMFQYLMELNLEQFFTSKYHILSQNINNIYDAENSLFKTKQDDASVSNFLLLFKDLVDETKLTIQKLNESNEKENNKSLQNANTQYDNAIYLLFDNLTRLELNIKYILANYEVLDTEEQIQKIFPEFSDAYLSPTSSYLNSVESFLLIPSVLRILKVKNENLQNIKPQLLHALQILTRKYNEHEGSDLIKDYYKNLIKEIMEDLIKLS